MKIAILGCGPSGLVAAHAAATVMNGHGTIDIYSKKRKSELFGAQFLHAPIPLVGGVQGSEIVYALRGSTADYKRKVYGDSADHIPGVSPELFTGIMSVWDIRATYNELWNVYSPLVTDSIITPDSAIDLAAGYDLVISTIPRNRLCGNPAKHKFQSRRIWALGDAPERGQRVHAVCPEQTVICSGLKADPWYRISNIFGHKTVEWPLGNAADLFADEPVPPLASLVRKPISTDCTCLPNIAYLGRYGEWKKGVLVHHVYRSAAARVRELLSEGQRSWL